jgi:hypothetical protein
MLSAGLLALNALAAESQSPFALRLGSGEQSLDYYQAYGYTAAVLGDLTQLATYNAALSNAIPKGSSLCTRIEQHRQKFQKDYERAHALGLAACLTADEVSLPVSLVQWLQHGGAPGGIDFESPAFWKLYRAKYREVLAAYPRVAFIIVRTGENYSHPEQGFIGRTVWQGHYDETYFRRMQRLIEETRKIVVDEFGRTLIWRTWDLGKKGFHADPKTFDRVLQGLPSRTGLMLSVKFTQTDFWRYNDFNPMIGRGGIDQIIEFQCAREYEGKGAFPDYVGPLHAEALRKASELGAKGVWIWDFGGGWGGPFLKADRWVRLNIEATGRLAQDPGLSPRALAEQWAAKEFGPGASTNVAEMLMLSAECVRKFMYVESFALEHAGWKPSLNLMRDNIIRGEELKTLYDGCKTALPKVIAEKEEALMLAARMRALLEISRTNIVAERGQQVYDEAASSLNYVESLAKVLRYYVGGMFLYYQWQETREPLVAEQACRELHAWREAWTHYQADIPRMAGAASLYLSQNTQEPSSAKGAMADLCESALRSLASTVTNLPP